ncbi:MAG: ribosomal-protein-alanine N-acetyltransferase [Lachnospiraceae bacterium]|nr:ribosomal-protein-alanine N-acetyltransferase [Lachnospiraceae bacterium]
MDSAEHILIRTMKENDIEQVALVERLCFAEPWSKEDFVFSVSADYDTGLVAVDNNTVAGFCIMRRSFDSADIINVAVAPDYRKKGIGKKLINSLLEEGNNFQIKEYILEVRVSNKAAICLYENAGFGEIGVRKAYYTNPTEDALIMGRYL